MPAQAGIQKERVMALGMRLGFRVSRCSPGMTCFHHPSSFRESCLAFRLLRYVLWVSVLLCLVSGFWAADQKLPFWAPTHIKSLVFYVTPVASVVLAFCVLRQPPE